MNIPETNSNNLETVSTAETIAAAAVFVGSIVLEKVIPGAVIAGLIGSTALFIDGMRRSQN